MLLAARHSAHSAKCATVRHSAPQWVTHYSVDTCAARLHARTRRPDADPTVGAGGVDPGVAMAAAGGSPKAMAGAAVFGFFTLAPMSWHWNMRKRPGCETKKSAGIFYEDDVTADDVARY